MPTYTDDVARAYIFSLLRGNQTMAPYIMYINCMVTEDIDFHTFYNHRETSLLDDIVFYSGWLVCGSCLTYPHMPEHVMR